MRIVVAGAGIGGLCAALALARAGHAVQVIERSAVISEVGAGIQLSPNAMKGLAALGVAEAVEAASSEPEALELRIGKTGATVFSIPIGPSAPPGKSARERYGAPYLHIHRADLVSALLGAAVSAGVRVQLSARVVAVVRGGVEGGEVRVGLDTGEIVTCDMLVGADGVRSTVRRVVFGAGADHPKFVGAVAWRALAPVEAYADLPATAVVWAGAGRHAVTYRVRRGALINFVGVVEQRGWEQEGWDEVGDKAELARAFEGWAPAVTAVIGAAREVRRWALFEREPMASWSVGRVVLLGDAVHAMPPFQAQGAAMAIEDAVVLANCMKAHADVGVALARYEALRKVRATKVQASARGNMGVFHRSNVVTQAATYGPMRVAGMVAPAFVHSRQDWIYAYDAQAVSAKG